MKYPLDCETTFNDTYLFWLTRFIRNKITSLSNRQVKNKERLTYIIQEFAKKRYSMQELTTLVKEIRNIGINSIHVYFIPLEKLYSFLTIYGPINEKKLMKIC